MAYALGEKKISSIRRAVKASYDELSSSRDLREESISAYVGKHYGKRSRKSRRTPIALIELAVDIYAWLLASDNPRANVTTRFYELKPSARELELAINFVSKRTELGKTIGLIVRDALFSWGIAKVGKESQTTLEIDGEHFEYGQPFCDRVSLDDWVHDVSAKSIKRAQFMGNYYRVPLDSVKNNTAFDEQVRSKVTASNRYDDGQPDRKVEEFSHSDGFDTDGLEDSVDLIDLFLPEDQVLVTLPLSGPDKPLVVREWYGDRRGPYRFLSFSDVPDNIMPLPPVSTWLDLHTTANELWNKARNQATRQKDVMAYRGGAEDDAKRIRETKDGVWIRVDNPESINVMKYGGADPRTIAMGMQAVNRFSIQAGNIDSLGGLGSQADTLGQEQLIAGTSNKRVDAMRGRVLEFAGGILEDFGDMLWEDPFIELPLTKRVAGTPYDVPFTFTHESKRGKFLDYNMEVIPYSLQARTPGERMNSMLGIVNQVVMPLMPVLQAQGVGINGPGLLNTIARLAHLEAEFEDVLVYDESLRTGASPVGENIRQSPNTTRTNIRINRPAGTRQGQDEVLSQMLLGNVQDSEAAMVSRPTG